jgi:hypothetical protein
MPRTRTIFKLSIPRIIPIPIRPTTTKIIRPTTISNKIGRPLPPSGYKCVPGSPADDGPVRGANPRIWNPLFAGRGRPVYPLFATFTSQLGMVVGDIYLAMVILLILMTIRRPRRIGTLTMTMMIRNDDELLIHMIETIRSELLNSRGQHRGLGEFVSSIFLFRGY